MFKILRLPAVCKPLIWIMLFSFMTMINGCYYFKVEKSAGPPQTALKGMQDQRKYIILHFEDKKWHFTDLVINEETVTGSILVLDMPEPGKPVNQKAFIL
jgi:hypothetical protein